ncbi:MbnP family protein [Kordiimonas lacus]|uniref:Copper-binding protein MbnP-like domain-containing protein n=1 Tax=Kordiimonas lacus TaxID=637679 RepID=A0A1G7EA63_9PROT|nr:MbnP family protein [Kordiimonas lacus]SDE60470.1 hypothetical protein SAMN04488071_3356 [Kordiimonas lacus]
MTRAKTLLAVTILSAALLWVFLEMKPAVKPISLRFHALVDGEPLVLDDMRYQNPGGDGQFKVRDFQFYLSNIRLTGPGGDYVLPDSYHLLRFDGDQPYTEIRLPAMDASAFDAIHWGIGVDPEANGTIKITGDLDPNNRMAWNWQVGYKFILFEGGLEDSEGFLPLVYHVGFDENYTPQSLPFAAAAESGEETIVRFTVDIAALFRADGPLDMVTTPSVKFDRDDAARIAAGFPNMISASQ